VFLCFCLFPTRLHVQALPTRFRFSCSVYICLLGTVRVFVYFFISNTFTLLGTVPRFPVYKKQRNPAKVYVVDSCLAQRVAHNDTARLLENIVFLEIVKSGKYRGIHYYSGEKECDFIVRGEEGVFPIQVTYTMQGSNRDREIGGLYEAALHLGVKKGIILTYNEEESFSYEGIEVGVLPVWKWLLKKA
jgi:predicted AAA+ superfamily ATPase